MVVAGIVVEQRRIAQLTQDYLAAKHTYYPAWAAPAPVLDDILKEIKGRSCGATLDRLRGMYGATHSASLGKS